MKKAAIHLVVFGLVLLIGWGNRPVQAQETKGQPYVVLVGINKYQDQQIVPRKHAEQDAKALYDLFQSKKHLGVDNEHIKLFLGSEDQKRGAKPATRENILDSLKWISKNAKKNDLVIVAFFGQGAPLGDRACYFAENSTFKDRKKNAIASEEIQAVLNDVKSKRFVVFLDVDFTGFDIGKETRPDPNLSGFYREFLGKEEDDEASRVLFMANNGLKPSVNAGEHGTFTQALLEGLEGKADKFGYEADGQITVEELAKYVREEVLELNRKFGKTDAEKGQIPIVLEGQADNFVIDQNPAVTAKIQQNLKTFSELVKKNNIPKEIAEEGENLLRQMPKLEMKQNLRKAYQKLADDKISYGDFQKERSSLLETAKLGNKELTDYATLVLKATQKVREEYVKDTNQGEMVDWAIEGLFKRVHEKMPSSIGDSLKDAKTLTEAQLLRILIDARKYLGKREDLEKGKDVTFSLNSMLQKLDRHTDYIDPETLLKYIIDIQGNFTGIGVQIRKNNTQDALEVVTPIKDSPAYKAGVYQGDFITKIIRVVDDKGDALPQPEVISTKGMSTEEAVKKILGPKGSKIKLMIQRDGKEKEVELIRGQVEVETVLGIKRSKDDGWDYFVDPENKIAYVRLTQFSQNTYRDLNKVMKQLYKVGIKGFILDLRFNPGGLLDSAVKISDLFIDDGMIVTIRPRKGNWTSYIGKSDGSYLTFPMVCLVNGYSASGSEIVSACLQDHNRAVIIGTRSYGKGSVQTIHNFDTGGKIKLTTATFWRPSGKNLNKSSTKGKDEDEWGVKPNKGFDLKIPPKELNDLQEFMRWNEIIHRPGAAKKDNEISKFQDRQLQMALEYLRGQIQTASKAKSKDGGS